MAKKRKAKAPKASAATRSRRPAKPRKQAVARPIASRPIVATRPVVGTRVTPTTTKVTPATKVSPATKVDPSVVVVGPPIIQLQSHVGSFFDTSRPGKPVVRPDDLVALRLELRGLSVSTGNPPRLRKTASGKAQLIVHFPPQAITERTFFETHPPGMNDSDPGGS